MSNGLTWTCEYLQETVQDVDENGNYGEARMCRQAQLQAEWGACDCVDEDSNCGACFNPGSRSGKKCNGASGATGYYCPASTTVSRSTCAQPPRAAAATPHG